MLAGLTIVSLLCYTVSSVLIGKAIQRGHKVSDTPPLSYLFACVGVISHIAVIALLSFEASRLNLSLSSMTLLVSGLVTVIFILAGSKMPIRRLGILVYPATIFSITFAWLWNSPAQFSENQSLWFSLHIVVSILAYALITLAMIQAFLYFYQDQQIKNRKEVALLAALPPLQTMDNLWFRLLISGFIALSVTLLTGAVFSHEIFGVAFKLKHHTILASAAWVVLAITIFNRLRYGLMGKAALIWTCMSFVLLQLGYFGTKLISESLAL